MLGLDSAFFNATSAACLYTARSAWSVKKCADPNHCIPLAGSDYRCALSFADVSHLPNLTSVEIHGQKIPQTVELSDLSTSFPRLERFKIHIEHAITWNRKSRAPKTFKIWQFQMIFDEDELMRADQEGFLRALALWLPARGLTEYSGPLVDFAESAEEHRSLFEQLGDTFRDIEELILDFRYGDAWEHVPNLPNLLAALLSKTNKLQRLALMHDTKAVLAPETMKNKTLPALNELALAIFEMQSRFDQTAPNLQSLYLDYSQGYEAVNELPASVTLPQWLDREGLPLHMFNLESLTEVMVDACTSHPVDGIMNVKIDKTTASRFTQLKQLVGLHFQGCQFEVGAIESLLAATNPHLKALTLEYCRATDGAQPLFTYLANALRSNKDSLQELRYLVVSINANDPLWKSHMRRRGLLLEYEELTRDIDVFYDIAIEIDEFVFGGEAPYSASVHTAVLEYLCTRYTAIRKHVASTIATVTPESNVLREAVAQHLSKVVHFECSSVGDPCLPDQEWFYDPMYY